MREFAEKGFRLLKNGHGKCLAVDTTNFDSSENGALIIQSNCNPTEKGQLWKLVQNKYQNLCNAWNKCLSPPLNYAHGDITSSLIQDEKKDSPNQHWIFINGNKVYNNGRCLSSKKNSGNERAALISDSCERSGATMVFC